MLFARQGGRLALFPLQGYPLLYKTSGAAKKHAQLVLLHVLT